MFLKNFLPFPLPVSLSEKVAGDDLAHCSAVIRDVLFQMHFTAVILSEKHVMSISYAPVTLNEPNVNSCCILAGRV